MDEEVKEVDICYGEKGYCLDIEDITPNFLKILFKLSEDPDLLVQASNSKVVQSSKWNKDYLISGQSYIIEKEEAEEHKNEQESNLNGAEILQALIASTAVYYLSHEQEDEDKCQKYLMDQLHNHNFEKIILSKHGNNYFIVAREINVNRMYIAFRGSKDISDWKCNLQVYRERSVSSLMKGRFHSGFLERAQTFPFEKFLFGKDYEGMDIVLCGHSLGGAIASIVAMRMHVEKERHRLSNDIKCITFGSPLFGDKTLQKELTIKDMYHFVCNNDIVPFLLSYAQSMKHIAGLKNTRREIASKYVDIFDRLISVINPLLAVGSVMHPEKTWITSISNITNVISDIGKSINSLENVYVPVGNFYFFQKDGRFDKFCQSKNDIQDHFTVCFKTLTSDMKPEAHGLENYSNSLESSSNPKLPFNSFPFEYEYNDVYYTRAVNFEYPYSPEIDDIDLRKITFNGDMKLRLSLTGKDLFDIVLPLCQVDFGFSFESNERIRKIQIFDGTGKEKIIIEVPFTEDPAIAETGTLLRYTTQFGNCQKKILPSNIHHIQVQTVRQIAQDHSVSRIMRMALQRGMALSKLNHNSGGNARNPILDEMIDIAHLTNSLNDENMFRKGHDFRVIMSNTQSYAKYHKIIQNIETYLNDTMQIKAKWGTRDFLLIGAAFLAGGATAWFTAGPGVIYIGYATSTTCVGGVAAASVAAGAVWLYSDLCDSNYENALRWINHQLLRATDGATPSLNISDEIRSKVLDLQIDDSVYSQEQIMLLLTNEDFEILNQTALKNCNQRIQQIVRTRCQVIQKIHRIRHLFSTQCFVGVIGLQDAGKSTLIKKIWGIGDRDGYFRHTEVPLPYKITDKVYVVDFPGDNSLESHAETFSICGPMNDMLIVVVPFTGDIDLQVSEEIVKVFDVIKGAQSTRVLLCINKCGLYLNYLKDEDELKNEEKPADYLRKRFVDNFNNFHQNAETGFVMRIEDVLFTDWRIADDATIAAKRFGIADADDIKRIADDATSEAKKFGIADADDIKTEIRQYLVDYGIYKEEEEEQLRRCVSSNIVK